MAAAGFDDDVAALELGVFVNPVSGVGELVARAQANQRSIFRMKVDGGVKQRQLFQRFADDSQHHFRFGGDHLAHYLAGDFDAQGEQVVGNVLIECRDALLKLVHGLRQAQGFFAPHGLGLCLPGG